MKKIAHLLLGRFSIVAVSIILQFLWLVMVMYQFSYQFTYANLAIRTIAIIVVLVIVNRWTNPANKLSWTFIILLSPVLGLLLYMIFGRSSLTKKTQERMDSVNREVSACLYQTPKIKKQLEREDLSVYRQSRYINDWAGFPLYHNTSTKYYSCGEEMFPDMLAELEKAEHFIFLEYFIVDQGVMFDRIVEVLEQKSKEGVDVRIVTPGIPDKKMIFLLTQSHYEPLLKCGVKIYQYTPGFIHAKSFLCDDKIGTVGSINLDYRSLFLHFECGVFMYKTKALMQLKEDCMDTFAASEEMTLEFCRGQNVFIRIFQGMMRLFAPLL